VYAYVVTYCRVHRGKTPTYAEIAAALDWGGNRALAYSMCQLLVKAGLLGIDERGHLDVPEEAFSEELPPDLVADVQSNACRLLR
jgi:hypothetical protein